MKNDVGEGTVDKKSEEGRYIMIKVQKGGNIENRGVEGEKCEEEWTVKRLTVAT